MGCDIHGYIEYEDFQTDAGAHYSCFGENLGDRDYKMFGLLAGVRRGDCIYPPRGIPENISFTVKSSFCEFVTDSDEDGEGFISKQTAEEWVSKGYSKYIEENYVTNPDWHTPSWLTTKEYEEVLRNREECKNEWGNIAQEWYAILAAMKALKNARFVFWFDN